MSFPPATPGTMILMGTGTSMGVPMIGCDCAVCTSSNPRDQRMRTGVAVHAPEGTFLIDTPPELRLQLVRERIGMAEAVIYTHAHADHILGLDDLRIFGYKRKRSVDLYCEQRVEAAIRQTFSYAFDTTQGLHSRPDLAFQTIGTEPFELLGYRIRPIRLMHGTLPVLGFRINDVAFCTDCNAIPDESWPLLEGLETLIIDALFDEEHPTHFSVPQAIAVSERVRPRRTYFTHVSHRLGYEATNARLPQGIELAYDGLRVDLGTTSG
ncbi:MAG: MBL fold metallo-hydrolase [Planctomycetaceae bacterium]